MIRSKIHVSPYVRGRPFAAEFDAVHAELFAALERDRKFEAAVAIMVREIELALEREISDAH
jgi:hypothetical protein